MGRICPILNHPLNDGVLVNDDALVSFIQKRNVDFLASEYVCRSCKREVEKLYRKKLKRATELHRSRYHDASVSTLKTSRDTTSSGASTASEQSVTVNDLQRKRKVPEKIIENGKGSSISEISSRQQHANELNTNVGNASNGPVSADIVAVRETSAQILTTYNNESPKLQENQQNLANIEQSYKNVTIRKRTIKDFYTPKPQKSNKDTVTVNFQENYQTFYPTEIHVVADSEQNGNNVIRLSQEPTTSKTAYLNSSILNLYTKATNTVNPIVQETSEAMQKTASPVRRKYLTRLAVNDMQPDSSDDELVIRRISQEPTTSKAATAKNTNKRRISSIIDTDTDDDDDDRALSLNAYNGTRLPHIQPLPPKRISQSDEPRSIARDIMDDYIKNLTGG